MNRIESDRELSIEVLEGDVWSDPPEPSTGLVRSVHNLRRRPVGTLNAWELARLIGQDVGIPWTLPLGIEILRDTAPQEAAGGFYDDDLLSAVLTRKPATWSAFPEIAQEVEAILGILTDLSPHIQRNVEQFHSAFPDRRPRE